MKIWYLSECYINGYCTPSAQQRIGEMSRFKGF